VAGYFSGTSVNFDPLDPAPSPSAFLTSQPGDWADAFVAKYSTAGTLQWAIDLGNNNGTAGIAVSGSKVYVVGPFGANTALAQLDPGTGSMVATVTTQALGGSPASVAVGPSSGNVYVLGSTASSQAFVAKLDASLNLLWTTTTTGGSASGGYQVAVHDAPNNGPESVYLTGSYSGTVAFGATALTSWSGTSDAFVWKLNADGSSAWAGSLGSNGDDVGRGIAVDGSGNLYVTGYWGGNSKTASRNNNFNPGPGGVVRLTNNGGADCFVVKLVPTTGGTSYTAQSPGWAKDLGGSSNDTGNALAVDSAGNVYTTGNFVGSVDFDPGLGQYVLQSGNRGGSTDVFVSELNAGGTFVAAASTTMTSRTTGQDNRGIALALDGPNVYITGQLGGTADFDPTTGTYLLTGNGPRDVYVWKLTQTSPLLLRSGVTPKGDAAASDWAWAFLPILGSVSDALSFVAEGSPRLPSVDLAAGSGVTEASLEGANPTAAVQTALPAPSAAGVDRLFADLGSGGLADALAADTPLAPSA
jgi:hypothetical protein